MKKVLMIGPGREVRGGISTVVNGYFALGIEKDVELKYIPTMEDGSRLQKLLAAIKAYLAFSCCVKAYDIVHVHMAAQASFLRKRLFINRAKRAGVKIVIHSHAADFDKYYFAQSSEKNRKRILDTFSKADRVIVLSEEWAEFFGSHICDPRKIRILYNGVSLPERKKEDYSDHNVLMLGRLGQRKGTFDLLKAIPFVLEAVPDAMFYLGGDGDIAECRAIAARCGISEHIQFLGWVTGEEKEKRFRQCSVFTLPSYYEGMPMALLEAMSCGLAVVSTNAGGIPQIIRDDIDGYRVEAGDVDALAERLILLLQDEERRQKLGAQAVSRIREKFDVRAAYDRLVQIYQELSAA